MANKKKPIPVAKKQQPIQKQTSETIPQAKPNLVNTSSINKGKVAEAKIDFTFGRLNYILMIAGLVMIAVGFILMIGGGSKDPKVFNPDIFDAQRLTASTIFILLGFAVEIVAILKKPKS
jgi:hypothetical protein